MPSEEKGKNEFKRRRNSSFGDKGRHWNRDRFDRWGDRYEGSKGHFHHRHKPFSGSNQHHEVIQPTVILLKSRDATPPQGKDQEQASTSSATHSANLSDNQTSSKSAIFDLSNLISPIHLMKSPVKLINEYTKLLTDGIFDYLTETTDFLVIGCIGLQGAGKSTIMSHLAHMDLTRQNVFKKQTYNSNDGGRYCTEGIDAYITVNRTILLDCQPLITLTGINKLLSKQDSDKSKSTKTENKDDELSSCQKDILAQGLNYAEFMMSTCHIVLVVINSTDLEIIKQIIHLVQIAETLKPKTTTTAGGGEIVEYFPQIYFVHTNTPPTEYRLNRVAMVENLYNEVLKESSHLTFNGTTGMTSGKIIPVLTSKSEDSVNFIYLPPLPELIDVDDNNFCGHLGYEDMINRFRQIIFTMPVLPLSHAVLTEKTWFHYAAKLWDSIRKRHYSDYNMVPQTLKSTLDKIFKVPGKLENKTLLPNNED